MEGFGMEGSPAAVVWDSNAASVRIFSHSFMGVWCISLDVFNLG